MMNDERARRAGAILGGLGPFVNESALSQSPKRGLLLERSIDWGAMLLRLKYVSIPCVTRCQVYDRRN